MPQGQAGGDLKTTCRKSLAGTAYFRIRQFSGKGCLINC
jgi:hypothetical protein